MSLPLYKKRQIVNKKHEVGKIYKPLPKNNGTYLIIRKLSNWETEKLFEWGYLRKPIFLGIFVNHFKLHNDNMITLKK